MYIYIAKVFTDRQMDVMSITYMTCNSLMQLLENLGDVQKYLWNIM